jgi:hypothetical protein
MRLSAVMLALLSWSSLHAAGIEEIRIADMNETVVLRADGSAKRAYRGQWNWGIMDERVGQFHAAMDPCNFERLASLPAAAGFNDLRDFDLPYSTRIVRTTIVRDGKSKTVERDERGLKSDPRTPIDIWNLEMAVRGVASQLKWEPISSGVRVRVALVGDVKGPREVAVRELGTNLVVAAVRTDKSEVEIPVDDGNFMVEVEELRNGRFDDLWRWVANVPVDKYVPVAAQAPRDSNNRTPPAEEIVIQTPNGWWLYAAADGSGTLGHGPSVNDTTNFKAGTIDLKAVMRELVKPSTDDLTRGYRFMVTTRENGGTPHAAYSKDSELILGLFEKAAQLGALTRQGVGFAKLWKEHPPVLKP